MSIPAARIHRPTPSVRGTGCCSAPPRASPFTARFSCIQGCAQSKTSSNTIKHVTFTGADRPSPPQRLVWRQNGCVPCDVQGAVCAGAGGTARKARHIKCPTPRFLADSHTPVSSLWAVAAARCPALLCNSASGTPPDCPPAGGVSALPGAVAHQTGRHGAAVRHAGRSLMAAAAATGAGASLRLLGGRLPVVWRAGAALIRAVLSHRVASLNLRTAHACTPPTRCHRTPRRGMAME